MAVGAVAKPGKRKFKSAGAARSPLLGIAMFSPAVLYIVAADRAAVSPGYFLCIQ